MTHVLPLSFGLFFWFQQPKRKRKKEEEGNKKIGEKREKKRD